jgi:diguanylate cyclase (GGDEF)-like protein
MAPHNDEITRPVVVQLKDPREEGEGCLVSIYGPDLGKKYTLDCPEVVVGRDADCDIPVPLDTVSRRHCCFQRRDGTSFLRDLGSTNGTFLNDRELPGEKDVALRSGDLVHIGSAIFKFLDGGNVEALYHEEVYRTMIVDGLTGAYNRYYFSESLEREMARAQRHKRPLSLTLFDLDHFKSVNDERGHLVGDSVLREVSTLVRSGIRREEWLARYGGEEFAVVLPETNLERARSFGQRIRLLVQDHVFEVDDVTIPLTISVGVAEMSEQIREPAHFISEVDKRLYEAKRGGRNRVAG